VNCFANGRRAFERPQDLFKFVLLAGVLATAVSATIGVVTLSLTGNASLSEFGAIWSTWWLGDAGGALIVAPFLVLLSTRPELPCGHTGRRVEPWLLGAAVVVIGWALFGGGTALSVQRYPIEFITLPVLVWAAVRSGPLGSAAVALAFSGFAIWGTMRGFGPFARDNQNESLLLVQAFMGVAAVTAMALAAAVLDRWRAGETIRAVEERLRLTEARERVERALAAAQAAQVTLISEKVARAEAEAAVAAREEFLSVAAHELRTPVAGLLGHTQLARRYMAREDAVDLDWLRARLETIERQVRRLGSLVDLLLDVATLQRGTLSIDPRENDLLLIVAGVVEQFRAVHPSVRLKVQARGPVLVHVDALRIEQVLTNLIDNAVKFGGDAKPTEIEVRCQANAVVVSVRDRGPGIPPDERQRVFERFHQAHLQRHYGGMGLGLYVSRELVELHGGTIAVEQPDGGGTRFVVCLPRVPAPDSVALATRLG
jgi:signal transduction histidine kinase